MHYRSSIEKSKVVFNRAINKYWNSPFPDIKSQINWRPIKWAPKVTTDLEILFIFGVYDNKTVEVEITIGDNIINQQFYILSIACNIFFLEIVV